MKVEGAEPNLGYARHRVYGGVGQAQPLAAEAIGSAACSGGSHFISKELCKIACKSAEYSRGTEADDEENADVLQSSE